MLESTFAIEKYIELKLGALELKNIHKSNFNCISNKFVIFLITESRIQQGTLTKLGDECN